MTERSLNDLPERSETSFTILTAWMFLLAIGCVALPGGCSRATSEAEEGEHLEHFIPPHKPVKFRDLVSELDQRVSQLSAATDPSATELQELQDIIGWIPELAADSDLLKADWETAERVGRQMQQCYLKCFGTGITKEVRASAPQQFSPLLEELRQLSQKSETEPRRPSEEGGAPE